MVKIAQLFRRKLIIAGLALVILLYSSISLNRTEYSKSSSEQEVSSIYERKGKVLILMSQQRSGSSFVGEFFNRFLDGYYLFEPLFMFSTSCNKLYEERLHLLKNISHCDFRELVPNYRLAKKVMHVYSHPECIRYNMCFSHHHTTLLQRYSDLCNSLVENYNGSANTKLLENPKTVSSQLENAIEFVPDNKPCGYPVNLTLMSSLCHSAELVSFKILRVCSISALEDIAMKLTNMGSTVYVVELVRDPRGIINSALKLELKRQNLDARLDEVCGRWRTNLQYVDDQNEGKHRHSGGIVSSGRYMRVRYEDIAVNPVKGAEDLYRHVGMSLPREVKQWIEETSINPKEKIDELRNLLLGSLTEEEELNTKKKIAELLIQSNSPYGTTRDPQEVLKKWRRTLSMTVVNRIQEKCGDVMKRLGYKFVNSKEEKEDMDLQLW